MKVFASILSGSEPAPAQPFSSREARPSGLPLLPGDANSEKLRGRSADGGIHPQTKHSRAAESRDEVNVTTPEKGAHRLKARGPAPKEGDEFQQVMTLAFSSSQPKVPALVEPEMVAEEKADPATPPASDPDSTTRFDLINLAPLYVPVNLQQAALPSSAAVVPALTDAALNEATLGYQAGSGRSGDTAIPEHPGLPLMVGEPTAGEGVVIPPQDGRGISAPGELPPSVGTTGAKRAYDMTDTANSRPMTLPAGQELPVDGEHLAALAQPEPLEAVPVRFTRGAVSTVPPSLENAPTAAEIASFASFSASPGLESSSTALTNVAAPGPAPATTRLETEIHSRVLEFRRLNADSMAVVVRPDAQTEIHLSLRLRGDQVDVTAQWTRGDASTIQAHWGQMQESLSSQGIRLAAISDPPAPSGFGNPLPDGFQHSNQGAERGEESFVLEPLMILPATAKPSARSTPRSHHPLLESWA